jgi:hypothetical protein
MFKSNVGNTDRVIRLLLAAILIVVSSVIGHPAFGLLALVPLVTAFVGVCPLYSVLHVDTGGKHSPRATRV